MYHPHKRTRYFIGIDLSPQTATIGTYLAIDLIVGVNHGCNVNQGTRFFVLSHGPTGVLRDESKVPKIGHNDVECLATHIPSGNLT